MMDNSKRISAQGRRFSYTAQTPEQYYELVQRMQRLAKLESSKRAWRDILKNCKVVSK